MEDLKNNIVEIIQALEKRILALENKQPEYVPPPVYGPVRWTCNKCGREVEGSQKHDCITGRWE